ncbi:MAG: STAS domain-containing protein, partial [Phycisphaerae bacterium]|nr:STAS domain-containing protein [Phycisphaerae bacterium]
LEDGVCLQLQGDIDLNSAPDLRVALMEADEQRPKRLIIDLGRVPYMDSSGVATLIEAMQRLRKYDGSMVLCGLQPNVRGIFEVSRLDTVFTLVDDLAAARAV